MKKEVASCPAALKSVVGGDQLDLAADNRIAFDDLRSREKALLDDFPPLSRLHSSE